MTSTISYTLSAIKRIISLPFDIVQFLHRFIFGGYASVIVNPQAKQLADHFRAQIGTSPCRYRLDNSTSATAVLPDGRKLGYAEYGSPTGRAIIMLHGSPGSRLEMAWHDDLGKRLNIRIIGVDRPGVGLSSPHPNRTVLDHAKDVEHVANHLGLDKFAVIGTSGGGPYVMACCYYLPATRLVAAANVCGMGDIQRFRSIGMGWPNWLGFKYAIHWAPWIVRWHVQNEPPNRAHLSEEERLSIWIDQIENSNVPQKDIDSWRDAGFDFLRLSTVAVREMFVHGMDHYMQDFKVLGTKWPFRVEEIRPDLPLHLWFGKEDANVSGYHGVEIAKRFRGQAKLHYLDETHISLQVKYHEQIFQDLLMDM